MDSQSYAHSWKFLIEPTQQKEPITLCGITGRPKPLKEQALLPLGYTGEALCLGCTLTKI
jgi:hypothetical protein